MIDTVIFDIGNVLTEWHWHNSFVEWFGEDLVDTLANATVMSPEWAEIDRGVLTEEEVVALLTKNAPDYPEQIRRIVHDSTCKSRSVCSLFSTVMACRPNSRAASVFFALSSRKTAFSGVMSKRSHSVS